MSTGAGIRTISVSTLYAILSSIRSKKKNCTFSFNKSSCLQVIDLDNFTLSDCQDVLIV